MNQRRGATGAVHAMSTIGTVGKTSASAHVADCRPGRIGATGGGLPRAGMSAAEALRRADRAALAQALQDTRARTLALFDAYQHALPLLHVPQHAWLNPPLWELGHIGWFQGYWTTRYSQWRRGALADPHAPRTPAARAQSDALYDSSHVPHATRWTLALPSAAATQADLARQLDATLALLQSADDGDDAALYFFRLAVLHEDMHAEAAVYMAQSLGFALDDAATGALPVSDAGAVAGTRASLKLPAQRHRLGSEPTGFAFDNELCAHEVALAAFEIDASPVRWRDYLPFVDSGGYDEPRWWDAAGRAWRATQAAEDNPLPRFLRRVDGIWQHCAHGVWQPLDLDQAAVHLTAHEAQAWCRWAGRRLPTEAEWECAALTFGPAFKWGAVWEWTADSFAPYPGFTPHPYRDYSAPWFGATHRVLRGASHATAARLRHPRYRNFFTPERNDIFAGFRSCAA